MMMVYGVKEILFDKGLMIDFFLNSEFHLSRKDLIQCSTIRKEG
jgi:hypothetical protein